jgi:hypothetical protein
LAVPELLLAKLVVPLLNVTVMGTAPKLRLEYRNKA